MWSPSSIPPTDGGERMGRSESPIRRVLIANRGEIAVRVIRACRDLGLEPVAVHSDADAGALHVRLADQSVAIGPPPARASYLRTDAIVAAAVSARADAVHPGYGFLAEVPALPRACKEAGLRFVGPPADVMEAVGDKVTARQAAERAGVPVVPGTGRVNDVAVAEAAAGEVGYPVLLKASAGGGGGGGRPGTTPPEPRDALPPAAAAASARSRRPTSCATRFRRRRPRPRRRSATAGCSSRSASSSRGTSRSR